MKTQYLERAQGRLAFDDRGTGTLVICVPSMGDVRQEYRFLAPMLVIMGTRDPDFKRPAQEAQLVATALHASVQMIEGAGHYPHAEMQEPVLHGS